jgi:hypothetical protein
MNHQQTRPSLLGTGRGSGRFKDLRDPGSAFADSGSAEEK